MGEAVIEPDSGRADVLTHLSLLSVRRAEAPALASRRHRARSRVLPRGATASGRHKPRKPAASRSSRTSDPSRSEIPRKRRRRRSEEHTSELQSLMRISYAVFCLKKKHILTHKHLNETIKHITTDDNDTHNL